MQYDYDYDPFYGVGICLKVYINKAISARLVKDLLLIELPDSGPNSVYCRYYSLCATSYHFKLSKKNWGSWKKSGTDKLGKAEVSLTLPSNQGLFRRFSCSKSVTHIYTVIFAFYVIQNSPFFYLYANLV